MFKTGDEDNKVDTLVAARVKDNMWYFNYKDSGKAYLMEKGNQLYDNEEHKATLLENGDIEWNSGYTTRLMNPCPEVKEC